VISTAATEAKQSIEQTHKSKEEQIASLQNSLQMEIQAKHMAEERLIVIETERTDLMTQISKLSNEVNKLTTDVNNLKQSLATITAEKTKLAEQVKVLTAEKNSMEADLKTRPKIKMTLHVMAEELIHLINERYREYTILYLQFYKEFVSD
jgi:chromosome segregation ATPase